MKEIEDDSQFRLFLQKVIVCTEKGYNEMALEKIKKKPFELKYKSNYLEMLNQVVHELLIEKKMQHL